MELADFFRNNRKVALAFSGGTDSAYLLYAAIKNNVDVTAYYVKSQFQPEFEYEDAIRLADELGAKLKIINVDIMQYKDIIANPPNRCYECKKVIFGQIISEAARDGYTVILDGTNASDDADDRPGMKALAEYKVLSPLRICNITKDKVRQMSHEANLFTWNKPAYACLATRVRCKETITSDILRDVESFESYLTGLGFSNHRVRVSKEGALLQIQENHLNIYRANEKDIKNRISEKMNFLGLDEKNYRK